MNIKIISVGKKNTLEVEDFVSEYEKRLRAEHTLSWLFVPGVAESPEDEKGKNEEAEKILKSVPQGAYTVLFDEKGKEYSSEEFSVFLKKLEDNSVGSIVFIIGGAFGVSASLKEKSKSIISLSKFTFPHMLVRMIVLEQIYRAVSIQKGSKYHHA